MPLNWLVLRQDKRKVHVRDYLSLSIPYPRNPYGRSDGDILKLRQILQGRWVSNGGSAARLPWTLCCNCEGHIWINLFSITYLLPWLRFLEINECINNPCKNGGRCYDLYYGFRCKCTARYKGKTCDQRKYEYEFFKENFL